MAKYVLTITLKNYPENDDDYDDDLNGTRIFYNEYLENNGSIVIINMAYAHNYEFISYDYDYKTIKHAKKIIEAYDKDLTIVRIMQY